MDTYFAIITGLLAIYSIAITSFLIVRWLRMESLRKKDDERKAAALKEVAENMQATAEVKEVKPLAPIVLRPAREYEERILDFITTYPEEASQLIRNWLNEDWD
jgi:flagellar biosynthesis/type III secretory pathway M-ring protein FliF/YscJ